MNSSGLMFVVALVAWSGATVAGAHAQDDAHDQAAGLEVGKRAMSTLHQRIATDRGRELIHSLEIHTRSVVKGEAIDSETIWRRPLDFSTRTTTKAGSHQRGFVGGRGWSGTQLLEGDEARRLAPTFCIPLTLLNLNALYPIAEATGEIIFRGRRALRVQLHDGKSDADHMAWIYFDQRNDMPLGMVFQWPVGINLHQTTVYLDKWQPGGGLFLPYRIEILAETGDRRVELVRAIAANVIDDRAFEPAIEGWTPPPGTPSSPAQGRGVGESDLPDESGDSE